MKPLQLFGTSLTCIFIGLFIGGTTNAINGLVSPTYFKNIMGWNFSEIWLASIAQGIFEGVVYGVIFAIIFTLVLWVKNSKISYKSIFKILLKVLFIVYLCWIIGGVIATCLAFFNPTFYQQTFLFVPKNKTEMLKYAWVGGSIWGGMSGSFLGLISGILYVRKTTILN